MNIENKAVSEGEQKKEIIEAVTLSYRGHGLMTCTFYNGMYYYVPVENGESKLLKEVRFLPLAYENFEGQTEITSSENLLGQFNELLWHADKFSRIPLYQSMGLKFKDDDGNITKLFKYSKLDKGNGKETSQMYVKPAYLQVAPSINKQEYPQFLEVQLSPSGENRHEENNNTEDK